jgi:hypothetical protein
MLRCDPKQSPKPESNASLHNSDSAETEGGFCVSTVCATGGYMVIRLGPSPPASGIKKRSYINTLSGGCSLDLVEMMPFE